MRLRTVSQAPSDITSTTRATTKMTPTRTAIGLWLFAIPMTLSAQTSPQGAEPPQAPLHEVLCSTPAGAARDPAAYVQVEALMFMRETQFSGQPIIVDANSAATFLSASDLDFDYVPGLRVTAGARMLGRIAPEVTYFGLFEDTAGASTVSPDSNAFLTFPDNLFGNVFVDIDAAQVEYSSTLHSFEANFPGDEALTRSFHWFAGFRYVNLDEDLSISAQRIVAGGIEQGAYDVSTSNHLYGGQLGARFRGAGQRFAWEGTGKAGVFGNDAEQVQSVTDFPNFPIRPTVSSSGGNVAFVGDLNLTARYRVTNVVNLRAGYSTLWIEGVALAPDQLDFNLATAASGSLLNSNGGMFLHGVNVGVEAIW